MAIHSTTQKVSLFGVFWSVFSSIRTKYRDLLRLCIQSVCGKIWTRKTLNTDTFHAAFHIKIQSKMWFNPFQVSFLFLSRRDRLKYPRKHQKASVFRGYRKGTLAWNWLIFLGSICVNYFELSLEGFSWKILLSF